MSLSTQITLILQMLLKIKESTIWLKYMESPLEIFKTCLDMILCKLNLMNLLQQRIQSRWFVEFHFNPNHSVILWDLCHYFYWFDFQNFMSFFWKLFPLSKYHLFWLCTKHVGRKNNFNSMFTPTISILHRWKTVIGVCLITGFEHSDFIFKITIWAR